MSQKPVYQLSIRQILLIAVLSASLAALGVIGFNQFSSRLQPTTKAENSDNSNSNNSFPSGISEPQNVSDEQNNIEVYRTISPGVAFIKTTSYREDYFGNLEEGRGSGSGSVIDAEGRILTNFHVIEDAEKLTVSLGGEKVYPARLIGGDPDTDIAVIKIEAPREALTVVPFGDSDKLNVGQKVLAIGNPFGLDRTLTTGVISGLQRPIRSRPQPGAPEGRPIEGAIQTDASINPGNSGGPLLDSHGRMIGINSQILSPAGGSVGVGFAVPISIARRIVPQLIQYGEVRRPKMGINGLGVEQLRQRGFQFPIETGLYVDAVLPSGSAGQAGIRGTGQNSYGDVIVNIDGEALNNLDDLYRVLDRHKIGDTIQVLILRDNKRQTIPVKLLGTTTTGRTTNTGAPRRF